MDANAPLLQTVRVLTEVIDATDPHTRGRSERLVRWTLAVARELRVPASEWPTLELGAPPAKAEEAAKALQTHLGGRFRVGDALGTVSRVLTHRDLQLHLFDVALTTHDLGGVTDRDLALARHIVAAAAAHGGKAE